MNDTPDLSAEHAILALMMADEDAVASALSAGVTHEWFVRPANQVIFRTICSLYERRVTANDDTVAVEVGRTPEYASKLVAAHDVHYAASFIGYGGSAPFLIDTLADARRRRLLRELAGRILASTADPATPASDTAAMADEQILGITTTGDGSDGATTFAAAVADALDPDRFGNGISTGFPDLDRATTGLHPAEYVLIGARPSMGKTAMLTSAVYNIAAQGIPVGIFSLEMSAGAIAQRIIASRAGVPVLEIRRGELSEAKLTRLAATGAGIAGLPIHINDRAEATTSQIRATLRQWMRSDTPPRVVFIDYLQMVAPDTSARSDSREREIARVSAAIKAMAKSFHVTIVALSQLSRKNETRPDKRPVISDLRDSGQIEQDADMVWLLHRPEYYGQRTASGKSAEGIAEVIVAKSRNGVTGAVELYFDKPVMTFRNLYNEPATGSRPAHAMVEADEHSPF